MSFFEFPHTRNYDSDLGWLIKTMHEVIENVQAQDDKIAAVEQLAAELKEFVNNYFDNLDVQQEINRKIDRMVYDGTLLDILADPTEAAVAAWLDEHLTPTTPVVDDTLTISGAAADAKVTGDRIDEMYLEPVSFAPGLWLNKGMAYTTGEVGTDTDTRASIAIDGRYDRIVSQAVTEFALFAYDAVTGQYMGVYDGTNYVDTGFTWFTSLIMPAENYIYRVLVRRRDNGSLVTADYADIEFTPSRFLGSEIFNYNLVVAPGSSWEQGGISYSVGTFLTGDTRARLQLQPDVMRVICDTKYQIMLFAYDGPDYIGEWNGTEYIKTGNTLFTSIDIPDDTYTHWIVLRYVNGTTTIDGSEYKAVVTLHRTAVDGSEYINILERVEQVAEQDIQPYTYPVDVWAVGGIPFATGNPNTNNTRSRCTIGNDVIKITCDSTHNLTLFGYDGLDYVGVWNGSAYVLNNFTTQNIVVPNDNYRKVVVLANADNSVITDADKNAVLFTRNIYITTENPDYTTHPYYHGKYAAIGDSITYGFIPRNYPGYPGQLKSFAQITAEQLKMTFSNRGVEGSTVAIVSGRNPMCERYNNLPDDADLITVMGGTNDIRNGVQLGTMNDRTGNTFYGALHVLLGGIYKKYFIDQTVDTGKKRTVVVCTPIKLLSASGGTAGGTGTLVNMDAWVAAIKEVAAYYSFPVLDFYNLSEINPHLNETVQGTEPGYTGYYNPYITDGTHPTQEGAELMAKLFIGFLRTLK